MAPLGQDEVEFAVAVEVADTHVRGGFGDLLQRHRMVKRARALRPKQQQAGSRHDEDFLHRPIFCSETVPIFSSSSKTSPVSLSPASFMVSRRTAEPGRASMVTCWPSMWPLVMGN